MEISMNCETLPAITTFPSFHKTMLTPLDLSLRSSLAPITPPSTPSPPRKKFKTVEDINHWRCHTFGIFNKSSSHFHWNPADNESSLAGQKSGPSEDPTNKVILPSDDSTIVITEDEETNDSNDDEFVDVLNSDDESSPSSLQNTSASKISVNSSEANDLSNSVLSRSQLIYDDSDLHNRAVEGFAKLFEKGLTTEKLNNVPKLDSSQSASNDSNALLKQIMKNKCEKRRLKMRKQPIDEDNSSPVSGTIIRKLREDEELVVRKGDIDPAFNFVEITDEAKAILASIDNQIGSYICQLCRTLYDDAFQLAQHRCTRIVHIEYRCSECDKVFNCPANLASHRRWHKPKVEISSVRTKKSNQESAFKLLSETDNEEPSSLENSFSCRECGKGFRRQAYLKKHMTSHQMLENLRNMESLKFPCPSVSVNYQFHHQNSSAYSGQHQHQQQQQQPVQQQQNQQVNTHYRLYPPPRLPAFFPQFDHRHINPFGEFYFPPPPPPHPHPEGLPTLQYNQNSSLRGYPITGLDSLSPTVLPLSTAVK